MSVKAEVSMKRRPFSLAKSIALSVDTFLSSKRVSVGFSKTFGSLKRKEVDGLFFMPVVWERISDLGVSTSFV